MIAIVRGWSADILPPMQAIEVGPRQQRVIAAAITILGVAVICGLLYFIFKLLARFIEAFSPVLLPLAVAGILAVMLRPFYLWMLAKAREPWLAAALVFLSLLIPLAAAIWAFGAMVATQVRHLLEQLPVWIEHISKQIDAWLPRLTTLWAEQGDVVRGELRERGGWLAERALAMARGAVSAGLSVFSVAGGLLSWIAMPIYVYFLLTARFVTLDTLRQGLPFLKEETREDVIYLVRAFIDILVSFFRGQVVVALAQGILSAVGFGLIGLQYGIAIGLILGVLNIVPYLGNLIGLGVALPLAYLQIDGGLGMIAHVLAVFAVVQAIESYLLTPRIMGERTGLHPMAIIFSLFFWGTAFNGLLGMILGIPLTAFLVVLWRLLKAKYIQAVI
jgi:predicted PurR-regulated permease PerM